MCLLACVMALEMAPVEKDTYGAHKFNAMNPNRTPYISDKAKELVGKAQFLTCFVLNVTI